ncbi:MAG: hypothetical protein ACTSV2_19360 [Candidatus Thorarchaeota archaeon]
MQLGTFGAIMKFAMDLEISVQTFYENALASNLDSTIQSLVEIFHKRCSTRLKLLERVRRENVTEMILEPIDDFESDLYVIESSIPNGADPQKISEMISGVENKRKGFFEKASIKIEFLIEAAESFERLYEENEDNLVSLR